MRKITLLLISGVWIITTLFLYILDDLFPDEKAPLRLYLFLLASVFLLAWLIWGIQYYRYRIRRLHLKIEKTDRHIDHISKIMQIHKESLSLPSEESNTQPETESHTPRRLSKNGSSEFIFRLRKAVPDITEGEERLCLLICQQMKNKEIAQLLNVDDKTIYTFRSRLKRKLPLGEGETMDQWIRNLGGYPEDDLSAIESYSLK